MKKILSIILCAALVIGMIPAAFATTTGDAGAFVYNFTTAGEKEGNWTRASYYKMNTQAYHAEGARMLPNSGYATLGNNGIAYKIEIPQGADGTYKAEFTYAGIESGGIVNIYLLSQEDDKKAWWYVEGTTSNSSVNMEASGSQGSKSAICRAIGDNTTNGENSVVKKIIANADTYNAKTKNEDCDKDFSQIGLATGDSFELKAGTYYVILGLAGANEKAIPYSESFNSYYFRPVSLKFVPDKTHTFNIDTDAITDEATAIAKEAGAADKNKGIDSKGVLRPGTGLQFVNELSEIDASDSNRWAVRYNAPDASGTASVQDTATLQIDKRGNIAMAVTGTTYRYGTDAAETKLALLLEISYAGKYKLTVNGAEAEYATAADVYMIPEADVVTNNNTLSLPFIKKYAPVGRIDEKGTSAAVEYEVGTVELKKENYYIVFLFNSDNEATYNNKGKQYFYLSKIVLTEDESEDVETAPDEMTQNELSFCVNANVAGAEITADIEEYVQGVVAEVSRGTTIALEAKPLDGYEFAGWKRGGVADDARGIYLDKSAEFDYKIMTNTYLTAVYVETKAAEEGVKAVEFWNEYGAFIARNEEKDGFIAVPDASLTGHILDGWYADGADVLEVTDNKISVSALSNALTRAMAKYSGTAAVTGYAVANGKTTDYQATRTFGDAVTATDSAATCWKRDGKIVAYDVDTYTHYVWDATQILSSYEPITDKTPIVVLEDTAIDGARMIEYDRGDTVKYEICEVGILFGSQDDMVISSCEHKATSQKNSNHGQFSAAPLDDEHTYARGYMIYKDLTSGTYNVIYAD